MKEAVVVLSKCPQAHRIYGIRAEKAAQNHWRLTWAFPVKELSAKRESYDRASISGQMEWDPKYPGCPYCGTGSLIICSCGHVYCSNVREDGTSICPWCERGGRITGGGGEGRSGGGGVTILASGDR